MGASRRFRPKGVLYLLPEVLEDMPEALKDAIAIRNAASVSGRCRCGAVVELPRRLAAGEVAHATMWHEDHCPAGNDRLLELFRHWQGVG